MKALKSLSLAVLSITFVLGSCSKYEEGPLLSLRTKKARITGEWKVDRYVDEDGTESNPGTFDEAARLELTKENTLSMKIDGDEVANGTWEFTSSKEGVIFDISIFGLPSDASTYQIIKLENDEMWLTEEEDYNEGADYYGGYTVYKSVD